MSTSGKVLWGIHGGREGDADTLFLEKRRIAIGWGEVGDLRKIAANRQAFTEKIGKTYPEASKGTIRNFTSVLYRFAHEMRKGDLVAYPSKIDKRIHVGEVQGEYLYQTDAKLDRVYPHQRSVNWIGSFPRTSFTQGALSEIGSAISLFQIKNYLDEFLAALEGESLTIDNGIEDNTVAEVAENIEQTTRDFILKQLSQEMKGKALELFIAHLLEAMEYKARVVATQGNDGGVDIIAHKDLLGFEPPIIKVQVKSGEDSIGSPKVQELYGNVDGQGGESGLFITLSTFTKPARDYARGKSNLRLIDGEELVDLVLQYYEKFDSRYKSLLPLRRVYIPQSLEEVAAKS